MSSKRKLVTQKLEGESLTPPNEADRVSRSGRKRKLPAWLMDSAGGEEIQLKAVCRRDSLEDEARVQKKPVKMHSQDKAELLAADELIEEERSLSLEFEPRFSLSGAESESAQHEELEDCSYQEEVGDLIGLEHLPEEDFDTFKQSVLQETTAVTPARPRPKAVGKTRRKKGFSQRKKSSTPKLDVQILRAEASSISDLDVDISNESVPTITIKKSLLDTGLLPGARTSLQKNQVKKLRKKKFRITAYSLWSQYMRPQLKKQHPTFDFSQISQLIAEYWHTVPPTEKQSWSRRARKARESGQKPSIQPGPSHSTTHMRAGQTKSKTDTPKYKVVGHNEVAVAAHLSLLGESLAIIGNRLQQHKGNIAVQGSLSVLLDSLLCAMGPLLSLTTQVPEMDALPAGTHDKTLDNIAYIMPGIG